MKKLIFVLFLFVFASSASATLYKWVDERGVVNFADDLDKVPPVYRNSVEELKAPKMPTQPFFQVPPEKTVVNTQSGKASTQAPPIAQTLIREGDFAMKLVDQLKLGTAQNEAEAESTLASSGIAPKNGWIADYPVTPDIIGELQKAINDAADSGRLAIAKNEAMKTFQDLTGEAGLSVAASAQDEYSENEPPSSYDDYSNPDAIDNYYDNEGPPIVTYYPPPWDYDYMYAWVPYPFWCSGFWFPGFFVLHDFDKIIAINHRHHRFTNHFFHPRWRRTVTIDPARRGTERPFRPLRIILVPAGIAPQRREPVLPPSSSEAANGQERAVPRWCGPIGAQTTESHLRDQSVTPQPSEVGAAIKQDLEHPSAG